MLICSCSPTMHVLDRTPNLAGDLYKKTFLLKNQKNLKKDPDDADLLKKNVESLTTYAFGFLIEEADRLMLKNYSRAKKIESKAHQYFAEAVLCGDSAISYMHKDYYKWLTGYKKIKSRSLREANYSSKDLELFYWTAAAYGGAVSSSGGDPKWIIKLPRIGKLLNTIVEIDSSWNSGAALVALISFTMNNPLISASQADSISKNLFDQAVIASGGKDMGPYLTFAESVSKIRQRKDEFVLLLNKALNIKINSSKEFKLTNTISKNRAEWLLDNIDEFFY